MQFFAASRLVIVAGKGGVGKTTVTATLATAAARGGPAHRSSSRWRARAASVRCSAPPASWATRRSRSGTGSGPGGTGEIRARTLTPDQALYEYLDDHGLRRLGSRLVRGGMLDVVATAAPGIDDILVLGKVKQLERAGTADLIAARRPGRRPRHHLPAVGQGPARRRVRRADQHPGARRAGDAVRPDPHPGRAGDAARGDPGQRAGRHRLRPGGPRRAQPRRRGGQRDVPEPAAARPRPGGGRRGRRCVPVDGDEADACGPRPPSGRAAPTCSTSRWLASTSGSRCPRCTCRSCSRPASARPRSASWRTSCWTASGPSPHEGAGERARPRLAGGRPLDHHLLGLGRRRQDHHRGRPRAGGRSPRPQGLRRHHRPGQAPGRRPGPGRRPDQRATADRRPVAGRAVGGDARHQVDLRRPRGHLLGQPRPGRAHPGQPLLPEHLRRPLGHAGVHGRREALRAARRG